MKNRMLNLSGRSCAIAALVAAATSLTAVPAAAQFASVINLGGLNGITGFRLNGIDAADFSGRSVASAGDVNGDGFDDLIVGAYRADVYAGESYVVFGKAGGFASAINLALLNGVNGFRLDGIDAFDLSGVSVAAAGDINGDGFSDIIIGANNAAVGAEAKAGESYVVFGKAGGFASAINLALLNGTTGFRLNGKDMDDFSGSSVASAEDVNGDGLDDIVIRATGADPNGVTLAGETYVVFGKVAAFASVINLGSLNGVTGFRIDGIDAFSRIESVASAGDVNGDGFADVVIGAPGAGPAASYYGVTYVVFGKPAGFASAINVSSLNGGNGFRLDGIDGGDASGTSVASAGDVNGDGFADLIIAARGADPNGISAAGETYVVFGYASGFASAIDLSNINGINGFRLNGIGIEDFNRSVASAGDVNGDGFSDIIIGAEYADPAGKSKAGESYVVFGKVSGFTTFIDLSSLNGTAGFRLQGIDADDRSGRSVASAGDVNGDGFSDIVIGADRADPGGNYAAGESYVVFGRAPVTPVTRNGSGAGQYISGGLRADTLRGLGGRDELEGRGAGDALNGGLGSDAASYRHAPAGLTADLANPAANTGHAAGDSYVSIENLVGSRFADTLRGNAAANVLTGGKGRDSLTGGLGPDSFRYQRLDDSLVADAQRDGITDFNAGTATTRVDRIDLSAIDAKTGPGNDAFSFIGTALFSGVKGQLRIRQDNTKVVISGDVNGDKTGDFAINLLNFSNIAGLTALDFIR